MTSHRLPLASISGLPERQLMDLLDAIPELVMRRNDYLVRRPRSSPCVGNNLSGKSTLLMQHEPMPRQ
jgi:hypothetical protein